MTATGERTTFSILITDDDPSSRDALAEIMRVQGYETVAAEFFGRDALPAPLRFADATAREIARCFDHRDSPESWTEFD